MDRKTSEKNLRQLMRLGKVTLAVTLPRELILELRWKENQKVTVKRQGKKIIIEDWPGESRD
jgi:antitoxin component of MazEF toxin-antitoxin module